MVHKVLAKLGLALCSLLSIAAQAQTVVSSGTSLGVSGAYILTSDVNNITITGSFVSLDLNGFNIRGSVNQVCSVTPGTAGNSCSGALSGTAALTINSQNVIVKNGTIGGSQSNGVVISNASNVRQDVTLQDIRVANVRGTCISSTNPGLTLINVSAIACGADGIDGWQEVTLQNVTASNNNGNGINIFSSAILENVHANYNKGNGVYAGADTELPLKG